MAFTSTPLSDPSLYTGRGRFGDETQLAQATVRSAGIKEHYLVHSETVTPLAGIERMLWVNDEPSHAAGNDYWFAALLELVRQSGVGVLLTGQAGNATISWIGGGENLLPMLLKGDFIGFGRQFGNSRHGAGLGRWRGVRRFLLRPLVLQAQFQFKKRWRPVRMPRREYSAIRSDFARSIKFSQQMAEAGYVPGLSPTDPIQRRLRVIKPGWSVLGSIWFDIGAAYGLEVRDPTQDRRVIELCLAIPEDQFQRDGVNRWLIRRAMQGYLPDEVRLNTRRGLQAADLGQRVLDNRSEIEAALAEMEQHDLARQVLDLPRMANVLASLQHGLTPKNYVECGAILMRGLMAGLFMLRF
jgi:asparagine synthase (glutamine-hydrolysing)